MSALYTHQIPETAGPVNYRLGRHVEHDPASKRYAYDTSSLVATPVFHTRHVPVFDQGDIGSCTGNAGVGCLATGPFYTGMSANYPQVQINEDLAVAMYSRATTVDDIEGTYPPDDTGSSGLAVAKCLAAGGYIAGYQHTFSMPDMLKALSVTPVMIGINWYDSFDTPDVHGVVKIAKHAQVRGGHEIYADEIAMILGKYHVGLTNSWGPSWGHRGRFYLSLDDVERLLDEDGDVTVPIPADTPLPVPAPAPVPPLAPAQEPADVELLAAIQRWATLKGLA